MPAHVYASVAVGAGKAGELADSQQESLQASVLQKLGYELGSPDALSHAGVTGTF